MRQLGARGADISGDRFSVALPIWYHNMNLIGIAYAETTMEPYVIRSPDAIFLRRKITENVRNFAILIRENRH